MRRIDDGRLRKILLPGSTRIDLVKSEVKPYKPYMKLHATAHT
jgi:hypothetical protein